VAVSNTATVTITVRYKIHEILEVSQPALAVTRTEPAWDASNPARYQIEFPDSPQAYIASRLAPGFEGFAPTASERLTQAGTAANLQLHYHSVAANPNTIVAANVRISPQNAFTDTLAVGLIFGGTNLGSHYYSTQGYTGEDTWLRLSRSVDTSSLPSGRYKYTLNISSPHLTSDSVTQLVGYANVVNESDSPYGAGWTFAGVGRLRLYNNDPEVGSGALVLLGDGRAHWFAKQGNSYLRPAGTFMQLVAQSGSFLLTDACGTQRRFESIGNGWYMMTARRERWGDETLYQYTDADNDGQQDDLALITDPWGREVTFTYSSGKLASITDFAGRQLVLGHSGGNLVSLIKPDPDGAGPADPQQIAYQYLSRRLIEADYGLGVTLGAVRLVRAFMRLFALLGGGKVREFPLLGWTSTLTCHDRAVTRHR